MICDEIDKSCDGYDFKEILINLVSRMDKVVDGGKAYCELFDEKFNSLSIREPLNPEDPFTILNYPEFLEMVKTNTSGTCIFSYEMKGITYNDLNVYFRWVPSFNENHERFLVVAGISHFAVVTKVPIFVIYGSVGVIGIMIFTIVSLLIVVHKRENCQCKSK